MSSHRFLIAATEDAFDALDRAIAAVPEEKRSWKPLDEGRNVPSQLLGLASMSDWSAKTLTTGDPGKMDEEAMAEWQALIAQDVSFEEAAKKNSESLAAWMKVLAELDPAKFERKYDMTEQWSMTGEQVAATPAHQAIYHLGQVSFMQTMLGDHESFSMPTATKPGFQGTDPRDFLKGYADEMVGELVRLYDGTPDDKKTWTPAPGTRSIQDQMGEVAQAFGWATEILKAKVAPNWTEETMRAEAGKREALLKDGLEKPLKAAVAEWKSAVDSLTVEDMDVEIDMFMPGWKESMRSNAYYPVWNAVYHQGAASYVQTLYGDKAMH